MLNDDFLILEYMKLGINFGSEIPIGLCLGKNVNASQKTKGFSGGEMNWNKFSIKVNNGKLKKGVLKIDKFFESKPKF